MLQELIRAFLLIFVAEMGDKTQIIAMTFATQYKIKEVILGVIIGVFFNHGLAIILGRYISTIIPMSSLQILAGIMFVVFGILALQDEGVEDEKEKKSYGPILTVALAFFIGELGDKTQLTAMTLSAEGSYPILILMGTILGMVATSSLGIFVGTKIGDKVPDLYIKIVSSFVFIIFGSLKLYGQLPSSILRPLNILIFIGFIFLIEYYFINKLIKNRKVSKTPIQEAAERLYIQNKVLSNAIENICLGEDSCGDCQGLDCIIGYTKYILKDSRENKNYYRDEKVDLKDIDKKNFDKEKVIYALSLIIKDYKENGFISDENFVVNKTKRYLEMILFKKEIKANNLKDYLSEVENINKEIEKDLEIDLRIV